MHFCQDEIWAFLMMFPFIGGMIAWLKHRLHRHKKCHEKDLQKAKILSGLKLR
jgi:hypothetical protein